MDVISILKDLHAVSGARMSIHSVDGEELFAYPPTLSPFCERVQRDYFVHRNCIQCDRQACEVLKTSKEPHIYQCGCGLYEGVAPIFHYGVLSGYLMMGQVRDDRATSAALIKDSSEKLFADEAEWRHYFETLRILPAEQLNSFVHLMGIVAEHLTNYNRIHSKESGLPEQIKKYIHQNFNTGIKLEEIATRFDCSKSTVMNVFRKQYGVTVIAYLNRVRLEQAGKLICDTDLSFKEIAAECGFYDQNYFSKQFASHYGCSPTAFRNHCKE